MFAGVVPYSIQVIVFTVDAVTTQESCSAGHNMLGCFVIMQGKFMPGGVVFKALLENALQGIFHCSVLKKSICLIIVQLLMFVKVFCWQALCFCSGEAEERESKKDGD